MTVLVTGGAGYIGSHMNYGLLDRGERVVVLDNLSTGVRGNVSSDAIFIEGEISDQPLVRDLIQTYTIDAVIHFAGSIVVPESVEQPLRYYENNTVASRALIQACLDCKVRNFVFSSTAAVYGMPRVPVVVEETEKKPINPYGRSKLMTEWMLEDASKAYDLQHIALRYFNVAGADPRGRTGQSSPRATHLIKRASQVALGRQPFLEVFGTDYPTSDGTGVRDYIHVTDLIDAHLLALNALRDGRKSDVFNCGYGRGLSVRQIIKAVELASGHNIPVREAPRRAGDPPMLVADSGKLKRTLHWTPRYDDVDTIVRTALAWEQQLDAQI
jgi:UDP-glucose 4-epimerase